MTHPNRPPDRLIDKLVMSIVWSNWFATMWGWIGAPDVNFRMPPQRLPDGRMGYRVIGIRRHRCSEDD